MNIFKISRSYLSNKNKTQMAKLHSYISIFGIMFGITALIVVNAAMKGFSNYLIEEMSPKIDVEFILKENIKDEDKKFLIKKIKENKEVKKLSEYKNSSVYMANVGNHIYSEYYTFKEDDVPFTIKPDTVYFSPFFKSFIIGYLIDAGMTEEEAIVKLEDLYLPIEIKKDFKSIDQSIFKVEFEEHFKDTSFYFSEKTFKEHFFIEKTIPELSSFHIYLHDKMKGIDIMNLFKGNSIIKKSYNWLENKESFLNSIKLEQLLIKIVLFFIVLVSAFNIISTMTLIITEKKQDIYLLKTIGYSNKSVLSIFLITGLWYGLIGIILGTILGSIITFNLYEVFMFFEWLFNINMLPITVDSIPYSLLKDDLILINGVTLIIVLIASLIPSMHTLKMTPAEGLKDE